jgi:hypothetical protein
MAIKQMMECRLAEIRSNQAKMDANLKEIIAEMKAWRKEMTACEK